jgi:6-phosphogluconolactonase
MKLEIKIFLNPKELATQLAEDIKNIVFENSKRKKATYIALSGGNTPKVLFNTLTNFSYKDKIKWKNIHVFWGDERCVPPDDEQSNYGMTKKFLLDKIEIPAENIHRIKGEDNPSIEAQRIADDIKSTIPEHNQLPQFDINILGIGEDGHTASLFPGKELKEINAGIAGVAEHPETGQRRISLTYDVINNSIRNIFMVTGMEKAEIVFKMMTEKNAEFKYPASKIRAAELLQWYLDDEAASKIKKP